MRAFPALGRLPCEGDVDAYLGASRLMQCTVEAAGAAMLRRQSCPGGDSVATGVEPVCESQAATNNI